MLFRYLIGFSHTQNPGSNTQHWVLNTSTWDELIMSISQVGDIHNEFIPSIQNRALSIIYGARIQCVQKALVGQRDGPILQFCRYADIGLCRYADIVDFSIGISATFLGCR